MAAPAANNIELLIKETLIKVLQHRATSNDAAMKTSEIVACFKGAEINMPYVNSGNLNAILYGVPGMFENVSPKGETPRWQLRKQAEDRNDLKITAADGAELLSVRMADGDAAIEHLTVLCRGIIRSNPGCSITANPSSIVGKKVVEACAAAANTAATTDSVAMMDAVRAPAPDAATSHYTTLGRQQGEPVRQFIH